MKRMANRERSPLMDAAFHMHRLSRVVGLIAGMSNPNRSLEHANAGLLLKSGASIVFGLSDQSARRCTALTQDLAIARLP